MKIIDISVNVHENMVIWPGDPAVKIGWVARIGEESQANISALHYGLHTGTHIDVPLHFVKDGWNMDELDLGVLVGVCEVVQIPDSCNLISREDLMALDIQHFERILFKTRNSKTWPGKAATFDEAFVALGPSGADYLLEKGCGLVGIDYLSIAPYNDPSTTHLRLLEAGAVILEGLDLSEVEPGVYELLCLPIKLSGREGAPARAVLRPLKN